MIRFDFSRYIIFYYVPRYILSIYLYNLYRQNPLKIIYSYLSATMLSHVTSTFITVRSSVFSKIHPSMYHPPHPPLASTIMTVILHKHHP